MKFLAPLLLALLSFGAAAQAQPALRGSAKLVLAAENDWPPYSSGGSETRSPEGFAVELVRAVLASQGVAVEIIGVPFARCMLYARNGRVAGCFNATITSENREAYLWHAPAMFEEELAIFARADSPLDNMGLGDLRGQRVGYTNAYTYPSEFLQDPKIRKEIATSDQNLLRMLIAGRVDYILLNRMPGYWRIQGSPEFAGKAKRVGLLSQDGFWVAFSKTHPEGPRLAALFSQGLLELKRTGEYRRLLSDFRKRFP